MVATDDIVGIVGGTRMVLHGSTNFIRLHRIRPVGDSSPGSKTEETIYNKGHLAMKESIRSMAILKAHSGKERSC